MPTVSLGPLQSLKNCLKSGPSPCSGRTWTWGAGTQVGQENQITCFLMQLISGETVSVCVCVCLSLPV